ncbi:uncharacterized protein DFL_000115 [Arthrobotrys flagrans]|uniref:Glutathione S-transferase n=1 Tax=Arthrobotrys flagrans TaxID=97331 RepID=A0A437ACW2_ARTFL|nr:hypothetical protein DFL_000115 [Arthrobotrys flagrans]
MADTPSAKKAKLEPKYELLYWPAIPGRGEYVRLALEAAGVPYKDTTNESKEGISGLVGLISRDNVTASDEAPVLCPPILRVPDSPILLSQTPNILLYLGDHEGLAPTDDNKYLVHQYTLTALDLGDEAHNAHHPVGVGLYYEDQKPEALRFAKEFRGSRIPKFFGFFDKVIKYNKSKYPESKYLVGEQISYADTTVWQVVDGVNHAFPKKVGELKEEKGFEELFGWYEGLKGEEWLKSYLESKRRLPYALGIFRHYEELDVDQ